jgi:hypothetical protein
MEATKSIVATQIYQFVLQHFAKSDKIFLDFLLAGMKKAVLLQRQ